MLLRGDILYPRAYIQFLIHFHGDRDYFECHEVLEEYWKKTDSKNKDSIWVGLILLAVSTYHHRRKNFKGAIRTLQKALTILKKQEDSVKKLGLDYVQLLQIVQERLSLITSEQLYKSFNIPISDPHLLDLCFATCDQLKFQWGKDSDLTNINLVQRHKLRDRTNVIQERNQSLKMRKEADL